MLYLKLLLYFFSTLFSFKRSLKDTEQRQIEKFRKIFEHARANSPFYRELYHNAGLDDLVIKTKEDIEKVPVIDKNMMRKYTEEQLLTCSPNEKNLHSHYTSGSTGVPFKIVLSLYEEFCSHIRVLVLLLRCGWRPWKPIFMYTRYGNTEKFDIEKRLSIITKIQHTLHLFERDIVNIFTPPADAYQEMCRRKYEYFWTTPSILDILCIYMEENNLSYKFKCIILTSENLTVERCNKYQKIFDAKIISLYGSQEFPTIGYSIYPETSFHLFTNLTYLETIKSSINNEYELVSTNLENFTMPFIRFNMHDAVEILKDKDFLITKIGKIYGRNDVLIKLSSGEFFAHHMMYQIFMNFHECQQYKLVQYPNGEVALRLNIKDSIDKEMVKNKALAIWHDYYPNVQLQIEFTDTMEIDLHSGKFKTLEKLDV